MEDNRASLTIEELNDRIIQLENRIETAEEKDEFVDETPDLFDVEELTEVELENNLKMMDERLSRIEDSTNIIVELERMREEKTKNNIHLKTMNAACITRIVLETIAIIVLSVLIVGCSLDFNGHEMKPEKLKSTAWSCIPTKMDGMEVMKLVFEENGIDGHVFFMTRGEVKTRSFTTNDNEILFTAPDATWLFYTDYDKHLTIECEDLEVEFIRVRENI